MKYYLSDDRISLRAKGIVAFVLHKVPHHKLVRLSILDALINENLEELDEIMDAMNELFACQYCYTGTRHGGKFFVFFDTPHDHDAAIKALNE